MQVQCIAHHLNVRFNVRKVMGDTLKLNDTLRTLELEVGKMTQTGGMYSDDANARAFKETETCKEMKVAHPTVKQNLVSAIMRWFRNDVSTKMATKIAEKYSDTIKDMQEQVTELNKMMTGSDSIAPKHEELVKYNQSLELTLETLKTCRSLERKITTIDKMGNKKTMEMFEGLDEDDDEADDAEVKLNTEVAAEVKTLKDAKKTMAAEQVKVTKAHHAKISNGLYSADDKGTVGKQFMPNCKVGTNSTTYISKMLCFVESQPQKFGWCLHEIRRILKDFNQRKGTHYQGMEGSGRSRRSPPGKVHSVQHRPVQGVRNKLQCARFPSSSSHVHTWDKRGKQISPVALCGRKWTEDTTFLRHQAGESGLRPH